jgi:hypothetical protein
MALTANTRTNAAADSYFELPVAAGVRLFTGSQCALDVAGRLVLAGNAAAVTPSVGRCRIEANNTGGGAGAISAIVDPGDYWLTQSAGVGAITIADRGKVCFAVDDNTVHRLQGARRPSGIVLDVDATLGVLVRVDHTRFSAAQAGISSTSTAIIHARGASTANIANLAVFTVAGVDGLTYVEGERILLKDQGAASENGVYVCGAVAGGTCALTRALDADGNTELVPNCYVAVSEGTLALDTVWQLTTNTNPIVVGTTNLTFAAMPVTFGLVGVMVGETPDAVNAPGTEPTAARIDHVHAMPCDVPTNIAPDDVAAEGAAATFARSNHVHGFACAAPPVTAAGMGVAAAPAEGAAVTHARSDHEHAVGLPSAIGVGQLFYIYHTFVAIGAPAGDDVIFNADCPMALRILDCHIQVSTAGAGATTLTFRDAAGGGGAALSSALSTAATGVARNAITTALGQVALGGSLIMRRTDQSSVGEAVLLCMRTA